MTPSIDKKARHLSQKWMDAKNAEETAHLKRLEVEAAILKHFEDRIPEKGTYRVDGGIKIVTGFTENWDQAALQAIKDEFFRNRTGAVTFPFRTEYKPDNKAIGVLRKKEPEIYEELIPALSVVPKKPSFSSE